MNDKNEVLIQVQDLKKAFGKLEVLRGISTEIKKGEVVVVIGPSGSGKSTFLRSLNLLEVPTGGTVLFEGTDITDPKTDIDVHRQKIGMVFQHFHLFPHKTILENIMLAPVTLKKMSKEEAEKKALYYLEKVGMAPYINAKPKQLSGGQKQRVAIAGVVAMEPKCIVLDEPTAMLDPNGRADVIRTAHELNQKKGVTIILITHYMEEVVGADKVIVMDKGKVVMQGTPREIFSQVGKLKEYRLDVPQVTILADLLRQSGLDIPLGVLTREELVGHILRIAQIDS